MPKQAQQIDVFIIIKYNFQESEMSGSKHFA